MRLPQLLLAPCELLHPQSHNGSDQVVGVTFASFNRLGLPLRWANKRQGEYFPCLYLNWVSSCINRVYVHPIRNRKHTRRFLWLCYQKRFRKSDRTGVLKIIYSYLEPGMGNNYICFISNGVHSHPE